MSKRKNINNNEIGDDVPSTSKRAREQLLAKGQLSKSRHNGNVTSAKKPSCEIMQNLRRCLRNMEVCAGKLLAMHLKNFMCHTNLHIKFNLNINFLIGNNGSGKSAVLAALQIGLGAKARNTSRADNCAKFIKTGANYAIIEILICNKGLGAWQPNIYGDQIKIIRKFGKSYTHYFVKNAKDEIVTRKYDDLRTLLRYLNVQIDNPLFVMPQETTKDLLRKSNVIKRDQQNYQLFIKGTQIERIKDKLAKSLSNLNEYKSQEEQLKDSIENSKKDIQLLELRLQELNQVTHIRDKIEKLNRCHKWIELNQLSNECKQLHQQILELKQEQQITKERLERYCNSKSKLLDQIPIGREQLQLRIDKNEQMTENIADLHEKVLIIKKNVDKLQIEMHLLQTELENNNEDITDLENNLESRPNDNSAALRQLRPQTETIKHNIQQLNHSLTLQQIENAQQAEKQDDLKDELQQNQTQLDQLELHIDQLKTKPSSSVSVYGPEYYKIVQEIEKSQRDFSAVPRGPLGRYIQIRQEKYKNIIEQLLKYYLKTFVVNSKEDCMLLRSICQAAGLQNISIITQRFRQQKYNVRGGQVSPVPRGTSLLLDEIICDDAIVFNCLIDYVKIETVLLCENVQLAQHLTNNEENVPHNLIKIVYTQGQEYRPVPNYRMYSLQVPCAKLLQVNSKDILTNLLKKRLTLSTRNANLKNRLQTISLELKQHDINRTNTIQTLSNYQTQLNELQSKIEEYEQEDSVIKQRQFLLQDLNDKKQKQTQLLEKQNALLEKQQTDEIKQYERQKALQQLRQKQKQLQHCIKSMSERLEKDEKINYQLEQTIPTIQQTLKTITSQLKQLNLEQREKQLVLHQQYEEHDVEETELAMEEVNQQIATLQQKLKTISIQCFDEDKNEELREIIERKYQNLNKKQELVKTLKTTLENIEKSLQKRFLELGRMQHHMLSMMQFNFYYLLRQRNFFGSLELDAQNGCLHINVQPHQDSHNNSIAELPVPSERTNTASLSGGERSVATIAFLISLWSCVNHPFYFVDEFDVNTDSVNDAILTQWLLTECQKYKRKQFIFLTPLAKNLKSAKNIQILRFSDAQ